MQGRIETITPNRMLLGDKSTVMWNVDVLFEIINLLKVRGAFLKKMLRQSGSLWA